MTDTFGRSGGRIGPVIRQDSLDSEALLDRFLASERLCLLRVD